MKRNIIVILTLTLVCVLFVACGKEEIPQSYYIADDGDGGVIAVANEEILNELDAIVRGIVDNNKSAG